MALSIRSAKPQRIRDPLHNLIEFNAEELEHALWRVIQTEPFQRLRRIRQLGFSEFVFPGATHTRFAHSVGVFHVARQMMRVIRPGSNRSHTSELALAAALVHDVGHGMFSHAFEKVGRRLNLPMAHHEAVTEQLIRDSEISKELNVLARSFADEVADLIKDGKPGNLYDAIVSSQFDADRLDYMRRDRLMTGVESSGIDATWLISNLEVACVRIGVDEDATGEVETLVLGPKAYFAAENYVLSLFQLYPNIYYHKATKAAEAVFIDLMVRSIELVREGMGDATGLPPPHPIRRFAGDPQSLANALLLDDTVFWGALPMMAEAPDAVISNFSQRLYRRRLPKCLDVRREFEEKIPLSTDADAKERAARDAQISYHCDNIVAEFNEWNSSRTDPTVAAFADKDRRLLYKRYQESQSLLNQILIRSGDGTVDMATISPAVASAQTFDVCRLYYTEGDTKTQQMLENIIRTEMGKGRP